MKKNILILLINFFTVSVFSEVIVSGEIKNASAFSDVNITYYNNSIEWQEVTAGKTKLDEQGRFILKFGLIKATTATLIIGTQQTNLFLLPDDSLMVTDDFNKFDETILYKGRGASDNNYMAAELLEDFDTKANRYNAFTDAGKFKLYVDSLERSNQEFLKVHDSPEFSPEFRAYISATVKYRFINPRWMYKIGYDKVNKKFIEKELPENYFDFLKAIDLNDQQAADNVNYQLALMRYISETNDVKTGKEINDSLSELLRTEERVMKNYHFRKTHFNDKIRDYELTDFLKHAITNIMIDTKFTNELINDYKSTCQNPEYTSIIDHVFGQANKLSAGNTAPGFKLINKEGKEVALSSFKGKVVYIDFWATWCAPCMVAMSYSHQLMEKFKDRKDIVFLYVNVRDDIDKWKTYLKKEKGEGIYLFADKEQSDNLFSSYNFSSIPHYVLVDRDGKLIHSNAEGPDVAEIKIREAAGK